jgi:hypothetical protein
MSFVCSVPNCNKTGHARGMCDTHYRRDLRNMSGDICRPLFEHYYTAEWVDKIRETLPGRTYKEAASILGCSQKTIQRVRGKYGLPLGVVSARWPKRASQSG